MSNDQLVCRHCQFSNAPTARFCGQCGRALERDTAPATLVAAFGDIYCPHCEAPNTQDAAFCGNCGRALHIVAEPVLAVAPSLPRCPYCGAANAPDAVYCGSCGRPLGSPTALLVARSGRRRLLPVALTVGLLLLVLAAGLLALSRPSIRALLGLPGTTPTQVSASATDEQPEPTATPDVTLAEAASADTDAPASAEASPTDEPAATIAPTPTPWPTVTPEVPALPGDERHVSAATLRNETGIAVARGQLVEVEYLDGGWRGGPAPTWPIVGPDGDAQVPRKTSFPVPDHPLMTLVGGVGESEPVAIGSGTAFVSPADGLLWLGPNDDDASDNEGQLRVHVTLGEVQMVEVAPLLGDGLMQLSFGREADYTPVLSPDQTRLIYASELASGWQLLEGDVDGRGEPVVLTRGEADYHAPDFAPDGQTLLVSSNLDGDFDIFQLDSRSGSVIAQLTNLPGDEYQPRWLRDGSGYVFSHMEGDSEGIYLYLLDGTQTRLVYDTTFDGFASPSPDGRQIVFYSGRDGDYEIYIMNRDGSDQRRLTASRGRDASPAFSPDGRWIAFESDRNGSYDLFVMRPDGSDLRKLTSGADNDFFPVFSPDGQWLLFQSDRTGNMDVYRMPFQE